MKVKILGNTFDIEGDVDKEHLIKLSSYLNEKMHEVSQTTPTISSMKVAILAALNITNELFVLQTKYQAVITSMNRRSAALTETIEKELANQNLPSQ